MVEVRLRAVRVDLQSNTPVLLLQESEGLGRTLPIFIGAPEATAIAFALQGMDTPRPMTHDLIRDLLEALGADVVRVVVTELRSSTYYADIVLMHGGPRGARCRPARPTPWPWPCAPAHRCSSPTTSWTPRASCSPSTRRRTSEDERRGVDRGGRQPRGDRRRVPQLPRQHPPGGLLLLTPPAAGPVPRTRCAGQAPRSHEHPAAHPPGQDVLEHRRQPVEADLAVDQGVDHVTGHPVGQLVPHGAALVDRGQHGVDPEQGDVADDEGVDRGLEASSPRSARWPPPPPRSGACAAPRTGWRRPRSRWRRPTARARGCARRRRRGRSRPMTSAAPRPSR